MTTYGPTTEPKPLLRRNRFLWLLYQPYKYLILFPFWILCTFILTALTIPLALIMGHRTAGRVGVLWARLNSWLTPMSVEVIDRKNIDPNQSYVVVSNHMSYYDIFLLYGWLGVDFKWVLKQELRKVPALGYYCHISGHIFVDRRNREAAIKAINDNKSKITGGTSVLFFPEGSIYGRGALGEFKKGAYRFALDMDLPILPVTIEGTEHMAPYKSADVIPGGSRLTIHEPIDTKGCTEADIPRLIEESKARIVKGFSRDQAGATHP